MSLKIILLVWKRYQILCFDWTAKHFCRVLLQQFRNLCAMCSVYILKGFSETFETNKNLFKRIHCHFSHVMYCLQFHLFIAK